MTTSQEWAEKFFNFVPDDGPKKKPGEIKEPPNSDNPDPPLEPEHDSDYNPDEDDDDEE